MSQDTSEQASTSGASLLSQAVLMRERGGPAAKSDNKVVALPVATSEAPAPVIASLQGRDWPSALDLVKEASEAIRLAEVRNGELEAELNQVLVEASDEIKTLKEHLQSGLQRLASAEERAREAEKRAIEAERRANEAEGWLCRLHDAVLNSFGSLARGNEALRQQEVPRPAEATG